MQKSTNTVIWDQFTKRQQALLREYIHTNNKKCPPDVIVLKRFYWRLMKQRHRAFVDLKQHKNGAFGEYSRKRGILGSNKDYKTFVNEGGPR